MMNTPPVHDISFIVKEFTTQGPGATSSPKLKTSQFGLDKLNAALVGKIETLMKDIRSTTEFAGGELQIRHLKDIVQPELRALEKEVDSQIKSQVKYLFLPANQKMEQDALNNAHEMLGKLETELEMVRIEKQAVSEFIGHSPFTGKMQEIFEHFIPRFISKLIDQVLGHFFQSWSANFVTKRKDYEAKLESLEKKKSALEATPEAKATDKQLKDYQDQVKILEGNISTATPADKAKLEKEIKTVQKEIDKITSARAKIEELTKEIKTIQDKFVNMDNIEQGSKQTRIDMNTIGGISTKIVDKASHSTLDGMYLSADELRAKFKEADGKIANLSFNNVPIRLYDNLPPEENKQIISKLTAADAFITTDRVGKKLTNANTAHGFGIPADKRSSIQGVIDTLTANGWYTWEERGTIYIYPDEEMDKVEKWEKQNMKIRFSEETLTEVKTTGFSFPKSNFDSSAVTKALEKLGISEAGWKTRTLGDRVVLIPEKDEQKIGYDLFYNIEEKEIDVNHKSNGGTVILTTGTKGVFERAGTEETLSFLMQGMNVMLFNFSGYGQSTGKPTGDHLKSNMEAAYHHLKTTYPEIEDNKILCKALCMSGGPATHLASLHPKINLLLDQSYADFRDTVADTMKDQLDGYLNTYGKKFDDYFKSKNLTAFRNDLRKWSEGSITAITHLIAKLVAPAWKTYKDIEKVEGNVGLLFTTDDFLMKMDRDIFNNYKALTKNGKADVSIMEMPGVHGDSWLKARGGGTLNPNRDEIDEVIKEYQEGHFKEWHDVFPESIEYCFKEIEKLTVRDDVDPQTLNKIIDKANEKFFKGTDLTNFLREALLINRSYVGRQHIDLFLNKAHLKGNIYA